MVRKPAVNLPKIIRHLGTLFLGFAFGRLYQRLTEKTEVQAIKDLNKETVHLNEATLNQEWERHNKHV